MEARGAVRLPTRRSLHSSSGTLVTRVPLAAMRSRCAVEISDSRDVDTAILPVVPGQSEGREMSNVLLVM